MKRSETFRDFYKDLHQQYLLPIVRLEDPECCRRFCQELHAAGFGIIEITLTTPDALRIIEELVDLGICTGAGTVLSAEAANEAIAAGAQFLISPGLNLEIASIAAETEMPYLPGVYTPSEVMLALEHDLEHLKLFPAMPAGPEWMKQLQGPFPQVQWLPTGGIPFERIPEYMQWGAMAVGQGTRLVSQNALKVGQWTEIRQELKASLEQVQNWKAQIQWKNKEK